MAETWLNPDGLYVKFGLKQGVAAKGGQILDHGSPYRMVELNLLFSDLATAASILHDTVYIPKNARIDKVEIVATTAFTDTGASFTLNVGLIKTDRVTEIDYDGLVAVLPLANLTPAGDWSIIDVNHAKKGALIGTTTAFKGLVTVDWDGEVPLTGAAKIRIFYYRTA